MTAPAVGTRWRFKGLPGSGKQRLPLGNVTQAGRGPLHPGTEVEVIATCEAAESGAHDHSEDCVVVAWETDGEVIVDRLEIDDLRPVVQYGPNGFPLPDPDNEGRPLVRMVPYKRVMRIPGPGKVTRHTAIGLTDSAGVNEAPGPEPRHMPAFTDLFEEV